MRCSDGYLWQVRSRGFSVDNSGGTIIGTIGAPRSEMPVIADGFKGVQIAGGSTMRHIAQ